MTDTVQGLDRLLNRLLDAERQVAHYQRESADIRRRIHERFGEIEKAMSEMAKTKIREDGR